jgi:hypothetical protein
MDKQLQPGQRVTVNAYGGNKISRIVVQDLRDVVMICKQEEFERANTENRPPVSVGFHREDIIQLEAE